MPLTDDESIPFGEQVGANSTGVFSFPDGTLKVEGSEKFVTECIAKFGSERSTAGSPRYVLDTGLDHAWQWFSLHANHRMQAVNFFWWLQRF